MGIPSKCFTCGKVWGHLWTAFQDATAGSNQSQDRQIYVEVNVDEQGSIRFNGEQETPAERFFKAHRFDRLCCRRMFLSQPPHFPHVLEQQIPVNSRIAPQSKHT